MTKELKALKAAIYSRFSTDMQDYSSIEGQLSNCRELADKNGWQVVSEYSDAAISGSDDSRPEYRRLLRASQDRMFDVLIVDETSRLTRRAGELPRLLEDLSFRNQILVDCNGFDSRNDTAALLASVYGGIDSLELKKIKERTHRGLRERHKAGYASGGKIFGYRSLPVDELDPESKRYLIIDEPQANIVREIFERYADGESPKQICADLNARGVPSPGSHWKGRKTRRCRGWVISALVGSQKSFSGILRRERYIGKMIWNRRQFKRVPGTSKRQVEIRPESEWIVKENESLRIIGDSLWARVQSRLRDTRKKAHANNKRSKGRPPKYMLSGLMKCGVCGSNFVMNSNAYCCTSHTNGGAGLCSNNHRIKRQSAESALLENLKQTLTSQEAIEYLEGAAASIVEARRTEPKRERDLTLRLKETDAQLLKIVDAIQAVGISDTLQKRLAALESQKESIRSELDDLRDTPDLSADAVAALVDAARAILADIANISARPSVTSEDTQRARSSIASLMGEIVLKPRDGVLWAHPAKVKGPAKARPLTSQNINDQKLVAGAGFEKIRDLYSKPFPIRSTQPKPKRKLRGRTV
ncbi:MAG: recombinase family protein [Pseudomonadota bacterium]